MSKISINQISATFGPSGVMLFGLGSDNKVYVWSASNNGQWLPNWQPPAPEVKGHEPFVSAEKGAAARAARRAAGKPMKKKGKK